MIFSKLIKNLDLLNKIEKNDKIIIKDDTIFIDKNNFTSPFYRYFYNQNRNKTFNFLYCNIFIILIDELNNFINFYNNINYNSLELNIFSSENFFFYSNKLNYLKKCLNNLKLTYFNDKILINKINNFVNIIQKIIDNINIKNNIII